MKGTISYNSTGFWCLLSAISLGIHGAIAFFLLQKMVRLEIVPPADWIAVDMVTVPTAAPTGTKPFPDQSTDQSTKPQVTSAKAPEVASQTNSAPNSQSKEKVTGTETGTEAIAPNPDPTSTAPTPNNSPQPTPSPTKSPIPSPAPTTPISPSPTSTNNPKPSPTASPSPSPKPSPNPPIPPTPRPTPVPSSPKPSPTPPAPTPSPAPASNGSNGNGAIATGLTVKFGRFELADPSRDRPDQLATPKKNLQQLAAVDYLLPLNLKLSSKLSLDVTLGIDEQGHVDEIYAVTVQQGDLNPAEATQLAQRILSKWLFEPSLMGGKPVFQSYHLILNIEPNF